MTLHGTPVGAVSPWDVVIADGAPSLEEAYQETLVPDKPPNPAAGMPAWLSAPARTAGAPAAPAVPPEPPGTVGERAVRGAVHVPAAPDPPPAEPEGDEAAPPSAARRLDLVWFDPAYLPRLQRLAPPPAGKTGGEAGPPPAREAAAEAKLAMARAIVFRALAEGPPSSPAEVLEALESRFSGESLDPPPLVRLEGEVRMSLDEREELKILMGMAAPLAGSDARLKEALASIEEMAATPLASVRDVVAVLTERLRRAWQASPRAFSFEQLLASTERLLLERRHYLTRDLLEEKWIRAELRVGGGEPTPLYVPAAAAGKLPLFRAFPVRLLAEVWPQQDQYEPSPIALRAAVLGRLLAPLRKVRPA